MAVGPSVPNSKADGREDSENPGEDGDSDESLDT